MRDDIVFRSPWGRCVRVEAPPGKPTRYAIVATEGTVLGDIRWQSSQGQRRYVLLPAPQTAWCSTWLSEVGVWLRRLTRTITLTGSL